ncbi:MAG: Crp/Fnr family transcriptional regulator [Pseudomonadales bacterium]|nr:Crp/Fnr family transcriptional regulator [Pseudomonadales bacterium]
MQALFDIIQSYVELDEATKQALTNSFIERRFEKNEYIFTPAEVCNEAYILTQGLVRCFYIYDDKEINLRLLCEPSAVIAYSSYIQQIKTEEYVQAIEPCEGFMISRQRFAQLLESFPALQALPLQTAEQHYLSMERRLITIQYKSAEERLRAFQERMDPKIVERTPAVHVASYLGMAPESLSRAKRNLNKC